MQSENRGDHWACFVPELGFTVYGATRPDAEHEVSHALVALVGSFHGDLDGITSYLARYGVVYGIDSDASSNADHLTNVTRQVRIEAPIAD